MLAASSAAPATADRHKPSCSIPRPNGSNDGINALINDPANPPVINFARSSRGPQPTDPAKGIDDTDTLFVPFAEYILRC